MDRSAANVHVRVFPPAYQADERSEKHPAELPPAARPVTDHVLDVLVKPLGSCGTGRAAQKKERAHVNMRITSGGSESLCDGES